MTLDGYLQKAQVLMDKGNVIGALTTLEEARFKFPNEEVIDLLSQTRAQLRHMRDKQSYQDFYEERQAKPDKYYKFGRRIERAIRSMLGIRTRRVVDGCLTNPRYVRVEEEIRRGGYKNVLDIGCNEGHFSIGLGARNPEIQVTGIDIASTNIRIAKGLNRYSNVKFIQGFAENITTLFPGPCFDFIMLLEILEHVISVEDVLGSCFSVLQPGGRIAVTIPAEDEHQENHDDHVEHVRFFSDELIKAYFGTMPNLVVERIKLQQRPGKHTEWSSYITFTKPL